MEHTSAPVFEHTARTTEEEPQAGDAPTLKASTSSVPKKNADATSEDAPRFGFTRSDDGGTFGVV